MSDVMSPTSTDQALEMLTAALGYLAAADATAMTAEEQARCLKVLERATAIGTAARTSMLGAFTSGRGYSADAQYSAKAMAGVQDRSDQGRRGQPHGLDAASPRAPRHVRGDGRG